MARWLALGIIDEKLDAADKREAEAIAFQRHGPKCVRVMSVLDFEQDREEQQAGNRRRRRPE